MRAIVFGGARLRRRRGRDDRSRNPATPSARNRFTRTVRGADAYRFTEASASAPQPRGAPLPLDRLASAGHFCKLCSVPPSFASFSLVRSEPNGEPTETSQLDRTKSPVWGFRMRQQFILLAIAVVCSAVLVANESSAQMQGQENAFKRSERIWKLRDLCARNAQKAFPDYTAEDNAKRERSYRQCLEASNLPYEPSAPNQRGGLSHR
jgi:hypothetical protein